MTRGRKPKPEGTIRTRTNGNIEQKRGKKWIYIGRDPEVSMEHRKKYSKKKPLVTFPPVNLPDHIKPTKYPHYYVSKYGVAYREPRQCDKNGRYGEVNEYGLIELTTQLRGNPNCGPEFMYESVNIYFYDEDGKNIGYKKRSVHQLVAETWIPNPHGYTEVLHGDKGNRCNDYRNLRWGTHKENMQEAESSLPEGTIVNRGWKNNGKEGGSLYEKKNGEWVLIPTNKPIWNKGLKGSSWNTLPEGTVTTRRVNDGYGKFMKQNGEWVYQKKDKLAKQDKLC